MHSSRTLTVFLIVFLLLASQLSVLQFGFVLIVKAQESQNTFGNPSLPDWRNISVVVAGDGKSFTLDNADNLTWIFEYGAGKYDSVYQNGTQIVKDELWMLQVYEGSWKDIGSSVNVFYEQVTSYNVRVTQSYTSANGDYNVSWDFYGGFRPKISFSANIVVAGNYRVDWRTYVYKDYALNMTNCVKFWNGVEEAVVFDYSDVYETFGNITSVEGVEGWVKGKRFDLVFNVGSLNVGEFRLDPSFGYETIGTAGGISIEDHIVGSLFTITEAGTADSITVALKWITGAWTGKIKCSIYLHSDLSLKGTTEERTIALTSTATKYTFNFSGTKPSLIADTGYVLVVWGEAKGGFPNPDAYVLYDAGDANQFHEHYKTYDTFPDPLEQHHYTYKCSIFCNYTAAAGDTTKPTYSGISTNTTIRNMPCNFSVTLSDETALANYTFGTNNTGTWANESVVNISGTSYKANTTLTLNNTVGVVVQWEYWFADSSNNLNNTGIQSLTVTAYVQMNTFTSTSTFTSSLNLNHENLNQFTSLPSWSSFYSTSKALGFLYISSPTPSSVLGISHENVFTPTSTSITTGLFNLAHEFGNVFSSTATFTSAFPTSLKELGFQFQSSAIVTGIMNLGQEFGSLFSSIFSSSSTSQFRQEFAFQFMSSANPLSIFSTSKELGFQYTSLSAINSLFSTSKETLIQSLSYLFTSSANPSSTFIMSKEFTFSFTSSPLSKSLLSLGKELGFSFPSQSDWSSLFTSSKELGFLNKELSYIFTSQPNWNSLFFPTREYISSGWPTPITGWPVFPSGVFNPSPVSVVESYLPTILSSVKSLYTFLFLLSYPAHIQTVCVPPATSTVNLNIVSVYTVPSLNYSETVSRMLNGSQSVTVDVIVPLPLIDPQTYDYHVSTSYLYGNTLIAQSSTDGTLLVQSWWIWMWAGIVAALALTFIGMCAGGYKLRERRRKKKLKEEKGTTDDSAAATRY